MSYIVQQVINGLQLGFIYALIALGYSMVYGVAKLINFAHGDIFMVGAFLSYYAITRFHLGLPGALLFSAVGCVALALVIERFAYRPLRDAPRLSVLITALAVSVFLEYFCSLRFVFGPDFLIYRRPFEVVTWKLGDVRISNVMLIVIGTSFVFLVLLSYIVNKTMTGMAMRTVAYDKDAARLLGIDVDRTISLTFALGALMAGVGAVVYAIAYPQIFTFMGVMPGLKAFVAAIVGGMGSIPGALVGGLIMGLVEVLTTTFIPEYGSIMRDAFAFTILIMVLLVKPTGIFGESGTE